MTHPHLATPSGKPRARSLAIPFDGTPGPNNAITDVAGVTVGYSTIIRGEGPLVIGQGPVRTGVTAILPRGRDRAIVPVYAGYFSLNGNGELTGTNWIDESGQCEGPITITNTHSVGVAHDATLKWLAREYPEHVNDLWWGLPVAGETYDGHLNDINGFHVKDEHVFEAIESARGGSIEEGSVGGGTGMICYEFKGGCGTASRVIEHPDGPFTVGAFLQTNFGARANCTIAGVPIGKHITEHLVWDTDQGSVIGLVATDAPMLPHQLKRLARRIGLGIGRSGSFSGNGSGDIFLAFSTANEGAFERTTAVRSVRTFSDESIDDLFEAVVQAVDEAVVNSIVANETMVGRDGNTVIALPHDEVRRLMREYKRSTEE